MRQVARSQVQVFVNAIGNDQHVFQTQGVQLADQALGLRCIYAEIGDNDQTLQTNQLGEDGAQSSAVHLLVELLGVILRLGGEGSTAPTPDGAADGASASTTGALLTPRLLATTRDFGTSLLSTGTLTTASHVGDDSLVNQSLVEFAAKGTLGDFDSLSAIYIQLHLSFPS
ncbi:hypothetical protein D9M71_498710 [compost metagenome]